MASGLNEPFRQELYRSFKFQVMPVLLQTEDHPDSFYLEIPLAVIRRLS